MSSQPIHPSFVSKLDPEYIHFHNAHIQHIVSPHTVPWNPVTRNAVSMPGTSDALPVGSTKDYSLSECQVRVFTPPGSAPQDGWPVFIFFHGGGWSYGDINAENSFSSHMCIDAACVVVSVAYRLAPENPYPAALNDAVEALQWVHSKGQGELGVNVNQIAIGGSSSGGNLAAIAALKASTFSPPIPLVLQVLIVPVTDNTALPTGEPHASWKENEHTVWLSPGRMLWFRNNYLPNAEDYTKWDSSPIFAPGDLLAKAPKALILVAGLDILRDEGIAYGTKLTQAGVDARVKVYDKAPHQTMALDVYSKLENSLLLMPVQV